MPPSSYRRLLIARDLLRERYREPLRLHELVAAAGLLEFHFLRAYPAAFGARLGQAGLRPLHRAHVVKAGVVPRVAR